MNKIIIAVSIIFLSAATGYAQVLRPVPDLRLKTIDGQLFDLSDYKGKVVLINFWATWCPPCRQEIPDLIKLQRAHRRQGLQIIGVTFPPQSLRQVRRFAQRAKINYPIALGTKETKLLFAATETLPITAVIDPVGNVHDVIEGIMYKDEFDEKVLPMLSTNADPATQAQTNRRSKTSRVQQRTILVNSEGYRPPAIRLQRGVPARLTFIRKSADSCGTEISIPAYNINKPLPLNIPVVVQLTPNRSGRFKVTCGMDMFRGVIVVR